MSYYYEKKTSTKAPIVHITDGADTVPLKSWDVEISPTLTGKSAIEATQIKGKDYLNGATVVQGGFNINNGNNYPSANRLRTDNYIPITSGSYTIENDQNYEYVVYVYDETNAFIDAESLKTWQTYGTVFSISGNRHIRIGWRKSDNSTITADEITGYHCYAVGSKTVSTVNLGRTIYGGTAEVVNGTGKDKTLRYELDENDSWSAYSGASHSFWHNVATGEDRPIKQTEASASICNYATYSSASPSSAPDFSFLIQGGQRIVVTADSSIDTVDKFKTWLSSHNLVFVCPASTPTDFTFTPITPTPETALGVNNFWADTGDSQIVYYTQIESDDNYIIKESTLTSIANSIRTKTGNSAPIFVEDMADEILSIVTGQEPQVPISSSTLIADNSTLSETVTFTDDYHNYDILKIELARGDVATVIYATPEMLDTIAQYSNNSINFNELGTNIYVCYWKTSSTVWTRRNNRSVNLKYIYGLKFTNCTPVKTVFYNRQAINGPYVSFSPPEGKSFIKDYDYILFSTKTGSDDETEPCNNVFCPTLIEKTKSLFGDPFDNIYPIVLNVYNGTTKVTITDTTLTSYNYFYVVGIKLIFE